jgi:Ca2+-dependent lipid-binding protein
MEGGKPQDKRLFLELPDENKSYDSRRSSRLLLPSAVRAGTMPVRGTLVLTVVEGSNLKDCDIILKMDPYCRVFFLNQRFRTRVHARGGINPTWNQSFAIKVDVSDASSEYVRVELVDKDFFSDDVIGHVSIGLMRILGCTKDTWFSVFDKHNRNKVHGQIKLRCLWNGSGYVKPSEVDKMRRNFTGLVHNKSGRNTRSNTTLSNDHKRTDKMNQQISGNVEAIQELNRRKEVVVDDDDAPPTYKTTAPPAYKFK